jgi:hypothetical protein
MQILIPSGVLQWTGMAALAAALSLPGRAFGGCRDAYPDADVSARLAKPEYAACSLDVMTRDYANILAEQGRLLELLRPAYARRLKERFEQAQQQLRLDEYDAKLAQLREIVATLAAGATEELPAHGLLRQSKQLSQGLKSRISLARDSLEAEELVAYCKLDFHFRLRDRLQRKLRQCSQHGGGG